MSYEHDRLVLELEEAGEEKHICACGNDAKYDGVSGLWLCDDCLYGMDKKAMDMAEFNEYWGKVFVKRMF